jgi:O-antigen/teichoic acid export membrane protein
MERIADGALPKVSVEEIGRREMELLDNQNQDNIEEGWFQSKMPVSPFVEVEDEIFDTPRPSILRGDIEVDVLHSLFLGDNAPGYLLPSRLRLPSLSVDQRTTRPDLRAVAPWFSWQEHSAIHEVSTWILPAIPPSYAVGGAGMVLRETTDRAEGQLAVLHKLVKSSGIYALSSVAIPLVSLVLAPFLTHNMSPADYGILTILNTAIGLIGGITQLGLASAFFRAYSYDYSKQRDKRDVVAVSTTLLCLVSVPVAVVIAVTSPFVAGLLLGGASLGGLVNLAGWVVLLQNLTVPGLAWLRAETRPLLYSLLSISNLLITLVANIILVGMLRWGIAGSIIANGSGYGFIVVCTMPFIILRAGIKLRADIARNLLAFGLPLVINFVSYWILQLSDRYLLSLMASLTETARYSVVYMLGSAMSVVVMGPFTLAWPSAMFTIAKHKDATKIFQIVFRWFSMFLLATAFAMSLAATFILDWLFPLTYRSAAPIIPIIATSIAFYGVYYVFMVGANVRRKTWLAAVFTTVAALCNFALNLVLIPLYGAMGAAVSTLIAYIALSLAAYIVNQRIYFIPFEIGRFTLAFIIGIFCYVGGDELAQSQAPYAAWGIHLGALCLCIACFALLGRLPTKRLKPNK